MSFDAGSIIAHMDLDDAEFDRKLREDVAKIEAFERRTNKSKLSVELDQSGMNRARQQFQRFDQQITQDAQQRARSRGSVLGALMGIFGGHAAAGTAGGGGSRSLLGGILGGAGPVPTGIPVAGRALLAATGGAVGLGALPALLGGVLPLGVAGLGAGVIGLGAQQLIGTRNIPGRPATQGPLYAAAHQAMQSIQAAFKAGAQPLIAPLRQAFTEIPKMIRSITPELHQLFAGAGTLIMPVLRGLTGLARTVLPLLGQAFRAAAPLIRPLLDGFTRLLAGLLPGVIALLRAAAPAVHALAGILGELGSGIGRMLSDFAPAVRASSTIFRALGDVLAAIFPIIGKLAAVFARELAPVFVIFAGVIRQLLPYLTIVGRVLGALAGAVLKDLVSLFGAFAKLLVLISPSVKILADALSQMFTILESSGVFGVLSSALEQIVPSLAKLINQLVRQLAPELPVIIQAFADFSSILITLTAAGLTTLLQAITWLIAHTPRWVILLGAAAAAFFLLDAAIAANPIGATILAITLLVGAATLLARHWRQVWGDIKGWAEDAWNFLTHGWGQLLIPGLTAIRMAVQFVRDHWRQAWDDIRGIGLAAWNFLHDDVFAPIANFITQSLPNAFGNAVTAIGNAWNAVKNVVRAPVAWVIDHVVDGLISAFDWISGKVGGPHIPQVHPFGLATGGLIPGYGGGDRHLALLEGGEAVVSKETTAAHAGTLRAWGVPGMQAGGRVGNLDPQFNPHGGNDFFSSLGHLLGGGGKIIAALATGNTTALINAITSMIPHGVGGALGDLAGLLVAIPKTLIKDAIHFLVGKAQAAYGSKFTGHYGTGVAQWRGLVLQALGMEHLSPMLAGRVLFQMQTESGGDPNAINLWDSNAAAGDPSRGLLQVIMGTFRAYHWPGTSWNIYNPLANIAAAINYARHRYGPMLMAFGMGMGSGHGYDRGGWLTGPPNYTGQPEAVLTPRESEAHVMLARAADQMMRSGAGNQDGLAKQLDRLIKAVQRSPGLTGAAVAEALDGGSMHAAYRAQYSAR